MQRLTSKALSGFSLLALLVGFMFASQAQTAQAACNTLSGSFLTSPITTAAFSAAVGDIITVTVANPGAGVLVSAELSRGGTTVATRFNVLNSLTLSYTVTTAGSYDVFINDNEGLPTGTTTWSVTVGIGCAGGAGFNPGDGRLNVDAGAPVALYCQSDGILILDIDSSGKGVNPFFVSQAEIDAVDSSPAANTVIASGVVSRGYITLYRLTSGEFQLVTVDQDPSKTYNFIFDGCP